MGLFSKKPKQQEEQLQPQPMPQQNQVVQHQAPSSSQAVHHPVSGLPQNDQTAQNSNIDGILPATTETGHEPPQSNYTGFDDNTTAPPVQNDDQSNFIMDPVPSADTVTPDNTQTEAEPELTQQSSSESHQKDEQTPENEEAFGETAPEPAPEPEEEQPPIEIDSSPPPRHTDDNDLESIKEQALHQLTPLASHLDQSPEEKFHTTMMMLQATDDQNLVKIAYDAANAITDEKTRAQALLDIINEINYFTHNK